MSAGRWTRPLSTRCDHQAFASSRPSVAAPVDRVRCHQGRGGDRAKFPADLFELGRSGTSARGSGSWSRQAWPLLLQGPEAALPFGRGESHRFEPTSRRRFRGDNESILRKTPENTGVFSPRLVNGTPRYRTLRRGSGGWGQAGRDSHDPVHKQADDDDQSSHGTSTRWRCWRSSLQAAAAPARLVAGGEDGGQVRRPERPRLPPASIAPAPAPPQRSSSAWRCRSPTVVRPAAEVLADPVFVERMVERSTGHREVADEALEAALVTPLLLLVFGGRSCAGGTTCDVISSNEIYVQGGRAVVNHRPVKCAAAGDRGRCRTGKTPACGWVRAIVSHEALHQAAEGAGSAPEWRAPRPLGEPRSRRLPGRATAPPPRRHRPPATDLPRGGAAAGY